jgi:hypothetical protein
MLLLDQLEMKVLEAVNLNSRRHMPMTHLALLTFLFGLLAYDYATRINIF